MANLSEHLDLLGHSVEDRVTGFKGVVTSVCFDLFGCIQAIVNPPCDKEGKTGDCHWYDVNRLIVTSDSPVMPQPDFEWTPDAIAAGGKGPSERPSFERA